MSRWHYDHYVQFGQRAGGQTTVWGRGQGWGTWGSSWTERAPPGCWSLREVSPVHRVSGGSARFSSQAWGNVVGFLFFERPEGEATCQRAAARTRCLILSDVWQPTVSRVWGPTASSWHSAAASDCQEEWMWSKLLREITSEGFRRSFHLACRVTTWCRVDTGTLFLLPSSALALHLILVFNEGAVGFTSAAGPRLAAAGGGWRGACWVAWTQVWRCENLWTRPLGLKHILGGWAHSHAVLNWETRKSATCAQTCEPIWAEVTGDTSLHGNVRYWSTRKYCGAEGSGRHKMARKMWKMSLRMIKKRKKINIYYSSITKLDYNK